MLFKNRYITTSALLGLMALLWGCNQPGGKEELVVAHRGLPLTLVPYVKSEVITLSALGNMFEPLVEFDPMMKIRPLLAERWENPDDLTWVFRIRQGVRFHNGQALEAEDVVYSLQWARNNPASEQSPALVMVDSIQTVNRYTIRITTKRPYPILLNKIREIFIVPRGCLDRYGQASFGWRPVGTGAYRFLSCGPQGPLKLAAWQSYWGGRPAFARMTIIRYQDDRKGVELLESGQADIVSDLNPETAARMATEANGRYSVTRWPGLTIRYLGMDTRIKPFRDVRIRRAISLAIDREALIMNVFQGYGTPANQMASQAVFGFGAGLPPLECDPSRARNLLRAAGYQRGMSLQLMIPELRRPLGEELKRQMAEAGIALDLRIVSREKFFELVDSANFYFLGAVALSGDVSDIFDDLVHSQAGWYGRSNLGRYRNPAIDRLIEKSSEYMAQDQRLEALRRIMELTMADLPGIPLYVDDRICGISAAVAWQPRMDLMVLGKEVRRGKGNAEIR